MKQKVVFLQIGLSRMGDKRGISSEEIEVDADKDLVKARKVIFKSPAFDKIKSLDSEIRRYVRAQCFPFENGLHMVAAPMVDHLDGQLKGYHARRFDYINLFAEQWPYIRQEFPDKLRKLWNQKDYDVGDIASNFSMSWNFIELKTPTDVDEISSKLLQEEQRKFKSRMEEAYEEARMILRETCLALVTHLKTSLESDPYGAAKRISSSTVVKLQEFLSLFDLRNITDDRELRQIINDLRETIGTVSSESLKTRDALRHHIRTELSVIEKELTDAVTVLPTRRIKGI